MALDRIGDLPLTPPDSWGALPPYERARIPRGELRPSERVLFNARGFRVRTWEQANGEIVTVLECKQGGSYDDPCHYNWTTFGDTAEEQEQLAELLGMLNR